MPGLRPHDLAAALVLGTAPASRRTTKEPAMTTIDGLATGCDPLAMTAGPGLLG
jgi:hypothetical protein